jgi:hypothetical protein
MFYLRPTELCNFNSCCTVKQGLTNLIGRIAELDNLYLAYYKASKCKHGKSEVIRYAERLNENLQMLRRKIVSGDISVGHYNYFTIRVTFTKNGTNQSHRPRVAKG